MSSASELPHRLMAWAIALATGLGFIGVMSLLLTDGRAAAFLLDRNSTVFDYPFTIQNAMWLIFFGALAELGVRRRRARVEALQLDRGLLPEDDETMLRLRDLGAIRTRVRGQEDLFLQRLVARCVLQFQSSRSTDRANTMGRDGAGEPCALVGNRIALPFGDRKISRRTHLWVNYDPLNRVFSVAPESGANLAYLNDAAIEERMALPDRARISLGDTKLLFVAFCGDGFSWSHA